MAEVDWTDMADAAPAASIARGVTAGPTKPNGGGTFVFGFNSKVSSAVATGKYVNIASFNPFTKGASIRCAIKRAPSAEVTGFTPMVWIGIQSNPPSVNGTGYLLALSNENPHAIVLKKGAPSAGVKASDTGVLGVSSGTFLNDVWLHVRLDVITNPNGDVVLNCFKSDLAVNPVTAPVWAAIAGITNPIIDDALAVKTGSAPLLGGFAGIAFQSSGLSRVAYFDHVELLRQT